MKMTGATAVAGAVGLRVGSAEAQRNSSIYMLRLQKRMSEVTVAIEASYNAARGKAGKLTAGITHEEEIKLTDILMPRGDNFAYERQLQGTQRSGEELQRAENSIEDRCRKMRIYLDQMARDTFTNKDKDLIVKLKAKVEDFENTRKTFWAKGWEHSIAYRNASTAYFQVRNAQEVLLLAQKLNSQSVDPKSVKEVSFEDTKNAAMKLAEVNDMVADWIKKMFEPVEKAILDFAGYEGEHREEHMFVTKRR